MQKPFFARYAIWILVLVCFFVPFALRGARMAVSQMKNDVKDWLPSSFEETTQMEWFWQHFTGERFVVVSWDGCTEESESFRLLQAKLRPPVPPSVQAQAIAAAEDPEESDTAADTGSEPAADAAAGTAETSGRSTAALASERLERPAGFIGDRLGLFSGAKVHLNWGGRQEKWLQGLEGRWYFLTPTGDLYRWKGGDAPLASLAGRLWRGVAGGVVQGEHEASLGPVDGPWYYQDPRRLNAQLFKSVTTGPSAYAALTGAGGVLKDDPSEAARRLSGLLFGADGKTTCLLLTLTDVGIKDFKRVLGRGMLGQPRGRLLDLAEESGIPPERLCLGGPPVDNLAIDEEGSITLVRLVTLSGLLGVVLAYACFRTISATIIVFFLGGISAVMCLAIVRLFGSSVDAVLMSMPALVYILGISGAVHLMNHYQEAVEHHGVAGATGRAIAHGWKPAVLCNVTTAIGLGSLYSSDIIPIRKFGVFSAISVLATLVLLFTYLPAALELWPQQPRRVPQQPTETWFERRMARFWQWFGGGIIRHHWAVATTCVLVIATLGYGVTRISTSVNLLKLFDPHAKILQDYAWLEEHLGRLVPMEVVVRFDQRSQAPATDELDSASPADRAPAIHQLSFLDRMDLVGQVRQIVEEEFGPDGRDVAGNSLSALTFAPILPDASGSTLAYARRGATNAQLEEHRPDFLRSDFLRVDPADQAELWRISLRIGALKNVDYGQFVSQLKQAIEPVLAAQHQREQILQAITKQRPDGRFAGARVCLLGITNEDLKDTGVHSEAQRSAFSSINQSRIFVRTLKYLLTTSRVRVDGHDPARTKSAEALAKALQDYDCVVLVREHPLYESAGLQTQTRAFLDARRELATVNALATATHKGDLAATLHGGRAVSAVYTGVVPIVYKAQRTLLNSLIQSTFWSFVTITPLMMFVSRGVGAGIVAMLPNALPVFVIFGSMGWMGIQVDIGSMMTASIALGVAVDDTIHFLTWFREELGNHTDRRQAILAAYKRCATPTFQAALISGLGLSIFAFSTFAPTQRFGYLMLTILLAGMIAELVFFPALLAGPLGRVFRAVKGKKQSGATASSDEPAAAVPDLAIGRLGRSPLPASHLSAHGAKVKH